MPDFLDANEWVERESRDKALGDPICGLNNGLRTGTAVGNR